MSKGSLSVTVMLGGELGIEDYDVRPAMNFEACMTFFCWRTMILEELARGGGGEGEEDKTYCYNDIEIATNSFKWTSPLNTVKLGKTPCMWYMDIPLHVWLV